MTELTPTKLIAVVVPEDATDFFVNKVECIRYRHNKGRESSVVEPMELGFCATPENCNIIGTITKASVFDFDAGEHDMEYSEFVSLLESNGVYLNNPIEKPNVNSDFYKCSDVRELGVYDQDLKEWQSYESKTVPQGSKLLIIEKL